jgi:NAD+ synthetase
VSPKSKSSGFVRVRPAPYDPDSALALDLDAVTDWLVTFLRQEVIQHRGFERAVVALSGGVDSALAAALCARAFGGGNVWALRLPHDQSSAESRQHAGLVAERLGINLETIDITAAVEGYCAGVKDMTPRRKGNVAARVRMIVLFDQGESKGALPIGTGNKTERLLGYFTWHADDTPPVNPLGDLYKTQVWALARHLGIPDEVVAKPATADLEVGQTDEGDIGVTYPQADRILHLVLTGSSDEEIVSKGFDPAEVELVRKRLDGTHWKRALPTVAMLSDTAIGEFYLRPVDYR